MLLNWTHEPISVHLSNLARVNLLLNVAHRLHAAVAIHWLRSDGVVHLRLSLLNFEMMVHLILVHPQVLLFSVRLMVVHICVRGTAHAF